MRFLRLVLVFAFLSSACGDYSPNGPSAAIPNFAGNYTGTYAVTNCSESVAFAGFCAATGFTPGTILPIGLALTQSQANLTGTLILGPLTGLFTGTGSAGRTITGSAPMGSLTVQGITILVNVTAWNTTLTGNALTGTFTVAFTVTGVPGGATLNANIVQLSRP